MALPTTVTAAILSSHDHSRYQKMQRTLPQGAGERQVSIGGVFKDQDVYWVGNANCVVINRSIPCKNTDEAEVELAGGLKARSVIIAVGDNEIYGFQFKTAPAYDAVMVDTNFLQNCGCVVKGGDIIDAAGKSHAFLRKFQQFVIPPDVRILGGQDPNQHLSLMIRLNSDDFQRYEKLQAKLPQGVRDKTVTIGEVFNGQDPFWVTSANCVVINSAVWCKNTNEPDVELSTVGDGVIARSVIIAVGNSEIYAFQDCNNVDKVIVEGSFLPDRGCTVHVGPPGNFIVDAVGIKHDFIGKFGLFVIPPDVRILERPL